MVLAGRAERLYETMVVLEVSLKELVVKMGRMPPALRSKLSGYKVLYGLEHYMKHTAAATWHVLFWSIMHGRYSCMEFKASNSRVLLCMLS